MVRGRHRERVARVVRTPHSASPVLATQTKSWSAVVGPKSILKTSDGKVTKCFLNGSMTVGDGEPWGKGHTWSTHHLGKWTNALGVGVVGQASRAFSRGTPDSSVPQVAKSSRFCSQIFYRFALMDQTERFQTGPTLGSRPDLRDVPRLARARPPRVTELTAQQRT